MTKVYILIGLNYLFLFLGGLSTLLLSVSFSRTQRARFSVLRRLDGRQLGLTIATVAFLALGYAAYALKEVTLVGLSFQLVPGPGTAQVVQATDTGIDLELMEAAAHQANAARESFNAGQAHFAAGQFREAADQYQRSITALPTLSAVLNRGLSLRYVPDYPAAEAVLRTGLQLASGQHRERFEAHFNLYLSSALIGQSKFSEAESFATKALEIYKRIGDDLGQANAHLNIGNVLVASESSAKRVEEWRRALEGFSKAGNFLGQANVTYNLATHYYGQLDLLEAAAAFRSALALYEEIDNQTGIARASLGLAIVNLAQGELTEALTLSQGALDRAVNQSDQEMHNVALNAIARIRHEQGRFDEAITLGLTNLELARQIGSSASEADAHIILASDYRELGQLRFAEDHAVSAVEISRRIGHAFLLSSALSELGFVYIAKQRFTEAADAFNEALKVTDQPGLRAFAWVGLGMSEKALGHSQRAIEFFLLANDTFAQAGVKLREARETEQLITRLQNGNDLRK